MLRNQTMVNIVDYATTYFKYPVLASINGEPINKSLKRSKMELRANISSVDTDLGKGNHEYIGLSLANSGYV